ncbi:MAG: hypothetical protein GTO02_23030 [Candidatus Dadabacteria bacterium]|nr:hypothetical protein [Candidatus Dadabacteria bacterium]
MDSLCFTIFRSDDRTELDRMAAEHDPNMPFYNEKGDQIGKVVRAWREGMLLMGQVDLADDEIANDFKKEHAQYLNPKMLKERRNPDTLITCGMERKAGTMSKAVADKLECLIEAYENGEITKSTLIVDIDELYKEKYQIPSE